MRVGFRRLVRGHVYEFKKGDTTTVLIFRHKKSYYWEGHNRNSFFYTFSPVASSCCSVMSYIMRYAENILDTYTIREVSMEDLPLYISYPCTTYQYKRALNYGLEHFIFKYGRKRKSKNQLRVAA